MNAGQLIDHFERISEAPDAIQRLRRFILDLAVRGKLVEQDSKDEPALELLKRIGEATGQVSFPLPRNWVSAKAGRLLNFQYGKALPASDRSEQGRVRVFGSNGVVGYCEKALAEEPAIIVGRKGSAGALNLCDGPSWTTDVAYFLIPPAFFHIRFLFFALQTLDLGSLGKGVKPGLSRVDAYELPIAVPPLAEQHCIVAKVDDLLALCDRLEAAQTEREGRRDRLVAASLQRLNNGEDAEFFGEHARFNLHHLPRLTTRSEHIQQLRQTIRNFAVCGRLVPQDPNDEPAEELLKRIAVERARLMKSRLIPRPKAIVDAAKLTFRPPANWQSIHFGDVCNLVTSGSRGWAEYYADSGPKFIRAQNIRFGRLRLNDLACVNPPTSSEGKRTHVRNGDLFIVITGAGVTNPAQLDRDLGEAYVSQHVALIRPTTTTLSRWLLLCLMSGPGGRDELVERAYGAGKPGLNLDNIRSLNIPLPPVAEQHRIVAKVDQLMALCDQLEAQLTTAQTDCRRLLEAVLRDALTPALAEAA